jgi:hypothetical protein
MLGCVLNKPFNQQLLLETLKGVLRQGRAKAQAWQRRLTVMATQPQ